MKKAVKIVTIGGGSYMQLRQTGPGFYAQPIDPIGTDLHPGHE